MVQSLDSSNCITISHLNIFLVLKLLIAILKNFIIKIMIYHLLDVCFGQRRWPTTPTFFFFFKKKNYFFFKKKIIILYSYFFKNNIFVPMVILRATSILGGQKKDKGMIRSIPLSFYTLL